MALQATFRPIQKWPGTPAKTRKRATFKSKYQATLDLLAAEISKLSGRSVVVQVYLVRDQIRNDGWPRSGARPSEPGVIVSFATPKGNLSFPCDTFANWEDNLRAIALSLTALRQVDRYGVTRGNEQYRGFAQIVAPEPDTGMTVECAATFLAQHSGVPAAAILREAKLFDVAYRAVARKLHPDLGGSHDVFITFQRAADVLRRHHGR